MHSIPQANRHADVAHPHRLQMPAPTANDTPPETVAGVESLVASYTHGIGVDDVVMSTRLDVADLDNDGFTTDMVDLFHHKNLIGTTQELVLEDGTVVESYRYDSFGEPTIFDSTGLVTTSAPSGNQFLFTGREFDGETGLYHYRARTYDPSTGSFIQEDPLGYADGLNPVAYVSGNPVTMSDPFGTRGLKDTISDLLDFAKNNSGALASIGIDLLGPLSDIIDVVSAAIGKDIRGYIDGGFKKLKGIGWWKRAKLAAGGSLRALGGAVNLIGKIKRAVKKAKALMANHAKRVKEAAARAAQRVSCPITGNGCFGAGTLVLLASGHLVPIEDIRLGDLLPVIAGQGAPFGFTSVDHSLEPIHRLTDPNETWVEISCDVVGIRGPIQVELLRPLCWYRDWIRRAEGMQLWLEMHEFGVSGRVATHTVTRWERPEAWQNLHASDAVPVLTTFSRSAELSRIALGSSSLDVTADHSVFSATQKRWVRAGSLSKGELIETAAAGQVTSSHSFVGKRVAKVYNLEVAGSACYYVTEERALVHNGYATGGVRSANLDKAQGKVVIGGVISEGEAVRRLRSGRDVYAPSGRAAKALQKKAGAKKPIYDAAHGGPGSGYYDHYHGANRNTAHAFFGEAK